MISRARAQYLDPQPGPSGRRALPSVRIGDHVLVRLTNTNESRTLVTDILGKPKAKAKVGGKLVFEGRVNSLLPPPFVWMGAFLHCVFALFFIRCIFAFLHLVGWASG